MKRECDIILETILQYKKESTMKNIKVNALASLLVNVLNIVFPLITNPYLTRDSQQIQLRLFQYRQYLG